MPATQQMADTAVPQHTTASVGDQSQRLGVEADAQMQHEVTTLAAPNGGTLSANIEPNVPQTKYEALHSSALQSSPSSVPTGGQLPVGIPNLGALALEATLSGHQGGDTLVYQQQSPEHTSKAGNTGQRTTMHASLLVRSLQPALG